MTQAIDPVHEGAFRTSATARSAPRAFLAHDPRTLALAELAVRLGAVETSVLLQGETGVGKDAIAELVHSSGKRARGPFVRLNCAALPPTLLEGELFGSVRGAFTGAARAKVGYFEAAHGGTLFLDEIGELPLMAQVKLLNVLEQREVRRLGATSGRLVDVRFISATHRDLRLAVERKTFREDLYYRIAGFTLAVPPLRERPDDILPFVERFVRDYAVRDGRPTPELHPSTLRILFGHAWPGNVRELKNAIEHALVLAGTSEILPEHLPPAVRGRPSSVTERP